MFNADLKNNCEFEMLFSSILSKVSKKGNSWVKTTFFLNKNISLEISYILISQCTYTFRAAVIENQTIINQVFNLQDLFNRLSQLGLLDIFCNEVILWHLNGGNCE